MPDILEPSYQVADSESRTKDGLITGETPANAEVHIESEGAEEPQGTETPAEEVSNEESAPSDDENHGEEASTEEQPKKSKGVQKRIDELTRQRYEADRERENAKQEAEYWRKQAIEGKQPQQQAQPKDDAAPKFEDFESYEAFVEARAEYAAEKKFNQLTSKQREETEITKRKEQERVFVEKVETASKKYPDFKEVALGKHVPYNAVMAQLVISSDVSADVSYYLGKNLDVASRIANLPPIDAAKEIGRIEAKFSDKPTPSPKRIPGAPPPIKPVGGQERVNKSPQEMTNAEYRQWRMQSSKKRK